MKTVLIILIILIVLGVLTYKFCKCSDNNDNITPYYYQNNKSLIGKI